MEGPSGFRGTEAKRGGLGYQKKREKRVTGLGIYFDAAAAGLWHPAIFYKPMDIDSTAPSYVQELDGGPEFKEAYCLEGAHTVEKTGETVFTCHVPVDPCETGCPRVLFIQGR